MGSKKDTGTGIKANKIDFSPQQTGSFFNLVYFHHAYCNIVDPGCLSRYEKSFIPDIGGKSAPEPGSVSATLAYCHPSYLACVIGLRKLFNSF
jgi:hypothetical protein